MRAILLGIAIALAGCGGGGGASGPPAPGGPSSTRPPAIYSPASAPRILGVQAVLVCCVSAPGHPAPFPAEAMRGPIAQADALVRANSGGVASLSATYLDVAIAELGDPWQVLAMALAALHTDLSRLRHIVLVTRGPSGSFGSQGLWQGVGIVWQSKPDDSPRWLDNLGPALVHELGHNWGLEHTASGLMSGAAGDDLTFAPEQRQQLGWTSTVAGLRAAAAAAIGGRFLPLGNKIQGVNHAQVSL